MSQQSDHTEHTVLPKPSNVASKSPRKRFDPSSEQRKEIGNMSAMGIPDSQIADIYGITVKKLRKHCKKELKSGVAAKNLEVLQSLYNMATEGHATAAIFWAKTRCGFRDAASEPKGVHKPKPAHPTPEKLDVHLNDGEPNE